MQGKVQRDHCEHPICETPVFTRMILCLGFSQSDPATEAVKAVDIYAEILSPIHG